jgi:hypothetical protein
MPLSNDKILISLDSYLDVEQFLSLKDEFYYFYSRHQKNAVSTWTAGSISEDLDWEYFKTHPILYHTYHKNKTFGHVEELKQNNPEALATYLQLHFGAFNPYRILKLKTDSGDYKDFVDSHAIKNWVDTLPFDQVNCVDLFYADHYVPLGFHRDYNYFPIEDGDNRTPPEEMTELIWFRFDLSREFYVYEFDENGRTINYGRAKGYSITFDDRDWHGNFLSCNSSSITLKVEGKLTEDFKKQIYG